MNKNTQSTIIPIQSPWGDTLLDALKQTEHTLLIVCPYIKEQVVLNMQQALLPATSQRNNALHVRIITRVDPDDLLNGSSDIVALQHLLAWSKSSQIAPLRCELFPTSTPKSGSSIPD